MDWIDDGRSPEERLADLGLSLPAPFPPAASYVPVRVHGGVAYVSGHGPTRDGAVVHTGKLGADVDIETGKLSAQLTALNILASLRAELGELRRVTGFLKLLVLVNATPDFTRPHLVADGASDLIHALYGPSSRHARSAVGVATLPLGIATEIEAVVTVA
ncbi:RidA family protein [Actinoplanes sp. NPDC051633]|uniref:RidA family protein n=1 Tax=Actinoplanes sp. NPDC051633 TaxID=3155670 RepID=UPI00343FB520